MSISNAYDMGLLSRTFQVNNIFKVYLYICTHNKPSRFIFSNSNIRHVIASLVFQSRTATIQIQKNRGAIEIRFVSVSSHIPGHFIRKKVEKRIKVPLLLKNRQVSPPYWATHCLPSHRKPKRTVRRSASPSQSHPRTTHPLHDLAKHGT